MSISYAPVPSGPVPWEGNDFEYVSDEDEETGDEESECEYDSEDTHSDTGSVKLTQKCRPCNTILLSRYYTTLLQEEEYFSE